MFSQHNYFIIFIVSFYLLAVVESAHNFPKKWTACKAGPEQNNCTAKAIETAIHDLVKGNRDLGVLSIDPLHFNSLQIFQGGGAVAINLTFWNLDIINIQSIVVDNVTANWKKGFTEFGFHMTKDILLVGEYTIDGQVLILPIVGNGNCNLTLTNLTGRLIMNSKNRDQSGQTHFNIEQSNLWIEMDKLQMWFDNLFNGDKRLGDGMNNFLNNNWRAIIEDLKKAISLAMGQAIKEIANRIFHKVPLNQIAPDK